MTTPAITWTKPYSKSDVTVTYIVQCNQPSRGQRCNPGGVRAIASLAKSNDEVRWLNVYLRPGSARRCVGVLGVRICLETGVNPRKGNARERDITTDNRERSCQWTQALYIAACIPRPPHSSTKSGERLLRPGDSPRATTRSSTTRVTSPARLRSACWPRASSRVNVNARRCVRTYVCTYICIYLREVSVYALISPSSRTFRASWRLRRRESLLGSSTSEAGRSVASGPLCIKSRRCSRRYSIVHIVVSLHLWCDLQSRCRCNLMSNNPEISLKNQRHFLEYYMSINYDLINYFLGCNIEILIKYLMLINANF